MVKYRPWWNMVKYRSGWNMVKSRPGWKMVKYRPWWNMVKYRPGWNMAKSRPGWNTVKYRPGWIVTFIFAPEIMILHDWVEKLVSICVYKLQSPLLRCFINHDTSANPLDLYQRFGKEFYM